MEFQNIATTYRLTRDLIAELLNFGLLTICGVSHKPQADKTHPIRLVIGSLAMIKFLRLL